MKYSIVSAIIPGVSSVVRPNTPLHDRAGRGNSWHRHQPHRQPGEIAEIWQTRGTLDTASSFVMGALESPLTL